jgi:hypothetical protein
MIADAGTGDAWLVAGFFGAISPFLVWDARRFWRGPHKVWDGRPSAWDPGGAAYWHGFTRCIPLVAAMCALGFVPIGVGGGLGGGAGLAIGLLGLLAFVVLIPVTAGVFFFNRPRGCVPPHRRDEPGALAEFAAERRKRAQERRAARG